MRMQMLIGVGALLALTACEEKKSKITLGAKDPGACDLSLDGMAGKEFIFLELKPDKSEVPTHKFRMQFFDEEGKLKVKYNVGSVADMYTYECRMSSGNDKLICAEAPKVKDWCQALLTGGSDCSLATMQKFEKTLTEEDIAEGVKEGTANYEKFKAEGGPAWESFKLNNNNLGNKLRGILYVKVDQRNCQLTVTDNYFTIYNGKKVEDSNPAGTNPFVKNDQGPLLWENCTSRSDLVALTGAEYPEDPKTASHNARQTVGQPVHFWYLAGDVQAPIEGCTFTYDTWIDGKPGEKGLSPKTSEDGKVLHWYTPNTWSAPSADGQGNVATWVIDAKCADAKVFEKEGALGEGWKDGQRVACAAVLVQ